MSGSGLSFPRVLGVIPSRYASTRLPGKPLADVLGQTMVERVYRAAAKALERVVVATDDERIVREVRRFGGEAMMTPASLGSGTERMAFVARKIHASYYVNVQGDEPLMHPDTIRETVRLAIKEKAIGTAAIQLQPKERDNQSAVKVVLGKGNRALYFSRSMIPCSAHGVKKPMEALKHLGIYAYPHRLLLEFVKLKPTQLEQMEKLEQLRALYNGFPIFVSITRHDSIGVDTPVDLAAVVRQFKRLQSRS